MKCNLVVKTLKFKLKKRRQHWMKVLIHTYPYLSDQQVFLFVKGSQVETSVCHVGIQCDLIYAPTDNDPRQLLASTPIKGESEGDAIEESFDYNPLGMSIKESDIIYSPSHDISSSSMK